MPQWNEVVLRPMKREDLDQAIALLREADLPLQGAAEDPDTYTVAESAGEIVGMAGLERYGRHGPLRSVAASSEWRGRGGSGLH